MANESSYIGRYFGNYEITDEIDCGSFGCVYRARHTFLPRLAAVKLLHAAHLQSRYARDRFLQEARFLDQLKHSHILPIYEFGIDNGLPYLVTEYASGGSLRDLLRQRLHQPLPLRDAISIISQIGDALNYAHQEGIIHRDLKPENILFNKRGDALLADFGIAIIRTTATLEQVAEVSGTPTYMAPEAFRGEVSRRSDLYSLGCIAYELITGYQPFTAPDALSMALKHMQERPVPPTRLNSNLPSQISYIILKALEKRRVNRYPDILTFIEELQAFSTNEMPRPANVQANFLPTLRGKTKEQYLEKGAQLYSAERYKEALGAYKQALRLDPHFAHAHFGKGNALYSLGRYEEALIAFEQAIRFDPYDAAFHNNKGTVLYVLGRYREALVAYEQALHLDPHLAYAQRGKSLAFRRLGRSR